MRSKCSKALFAQFKKRLFYHYNLIHETFQITNLLQLPIQITSFLAIQCVRFFKKRVFIIIIMLILLILAKYLPQVLTHKEIHRQYPQQKNSGDQKQIDKKDEMTFYEFKLKYNKKYSSFDEELFRSIVFNRNFIKINRHNSLKNKTYTMRVNEFADLTPNQFASIYTSLYRSDQTIKNMVKQIILEEGQSNKNDNNKSNRMPSQKNKYYLINQAQQQAGRRHQQLLIENPQFTTLDEILPHSKKKSLIQRYIKSQVLKQSVTTTSSSNSTQASNTSTQTDGNFTTDIIDWTVHSGQIRYQGICGACYTFATSDTVASLYSIYKFGFFLPLSTQQVIDCSTNGLTYGCDGGFLQGSYAYMQIRGIQPDYLYPYSSTVDGIEKDCNVTGGPFKVASFRNINEGDCKDLVSQLSYGPVSIGIAGYRLQFYQNGIFNDCNDYIDHAVVLIAYKAGIGWKIKNSWGPQWGINGFAWIQDGNNCGICNMAVSAKLSV